MTRRSWTSSRPSSRPTPPPFIDRLRDESWLVRTPIGGLAIGRPQVQALLADRRLRSSVPDIVRMQGVTEGDLSSS